MLKNNLNVLKTKSAFKMKWKVFFIIFEGVSLKQIIKTFFGRWESDFKVISKTSKNNFFYTAEIIFTTWKMSVFGIILARIFPHSNWIFPHSDIHRRIAAQITEERWIENILKSSEILTVNLLNSISVYLNYIIII